MGRHAGTALLGGRPGGLSEASAQKGGWQLTGCTRPAHLPIVGVGQTLLEGQVVQRDLWASRRTRESAVFAPLPPGVGRPGPLISRMPSRLACPLSSPDQAAPKCLAMLGGQSTHVSVTSATMPVLSVFLGQRPCAGVGRRGQGRVGEVGM